MSQPGVRLPRSTGAILPGVKGKSQDPPPAKRKPKGDGQGRPSRREMDERVKIDMDPEEAIRVMLRTRKKREPRPAE